MTMLRDYSIKHSSLIAHSVDEDTDDLEPMDPSVFFGIDDDEDLEEDDVDGDVDDDEEDIPEDEEY